MVQQHFWLLQKIASSMSSEVRTEAVWLPNRASLSSGVSVNAAWCPQPFLSPAGLAVAERPDALWLCSKVINVLWGYRPLTQLMQQLNTESTSQAALYTSCTIAHGVQHPFLYLFISFAVWFPHNEQRTAGTRACTPFPWLQLPVPQLPPAWWKRRLFPDTLNVARWCS